MADDAPATRRDVPSPTFVFEVPACATRTNAADRGLSASVVVAAAAYVSVAAYQSTTLAYFAAFAVCLVPVMRAARQGLLDGVLGRLDAILCRAARHACAGARAAGADLAADGRRIRAAARRNAAYAPAYARAMRRRAEAAWRDNRAAARAACLFLRLTYAVACAAAAALADAAYEAARTLAPPVMSHLRAVIVKESTTINKSGEGAAVFFVKYSGVARLVKASLFLGFSADVLVYAKAVVGLSVPCLFLPCFAALFVTAVLASGGSWPFSLPRDDHDSNRTPTDHEAEPWKLLWLVAVAAYLVDVCLLRFAFGARPLPVGFLAMCHVKVIHVGKKEVQREEGSAEGGGKWRRAATEVLAASVVKVAAVGAVLGIQMAALSLVSLCGMTVFLLLSDDSDGGGDGAGSAGSVIIGGAEEVRSEGSNTGAEGEEGSALELEEHWDTSEEYVEEQRDEEPDDSTSSSMNGWDFVEADPTAADQS